MEEESLLSTSPSSVAVVSQSAAAQRRGGLDLSRSGQEVKIISNALHVATRCGVGNPRSRWFVGGDGESQDGQHDRCFPDRILQKNTAFFGDALSKVLSGLMSHSPVRQPGSRVSAESPRNADVLLLANLWMLRTQPTRRSSAPGSSSAESL